MVKLQNLKMEKIKKIFLFLWGKGNVWQDAPAILLVIIVGECGFFFNDQYSPIIKKNSILKILLSSNRPDFEY
ncbi:MAG: hypothetical protein ACK55Z_18900 [bacterium]